MSTPRYESEALSAALGRVTRLPESAHRVGAEGRAAIAKARLRVIDQYLDAGGVKAKVAGRFLLGLSAAGFGSLVAPLAWLPLALRHATSVVPAVPTESVWAGFGDASLFGLAGAAVGVVALSVAALVRGSGERDAR